MAKETVLDYYKKEYGKLKGKRVVDIVYDPSDEMMPLMGLLMDDKTVAWILCDEEGNGPGHLDIQEDK